MPIPINLNGNGNKEQKEAGDNNFLIDYNLFLSQIPGATNPPQQSKLIAVASDKDASLLLELWSTAERKGEDVFKLGKDVKLSSNDIIRLKSHGLICGSIDEVKLTNKGRSVITTMVLGENNNFLKVKKEKSYTEILASMDKRKKTGYRIPKFAANSHLIRLPKSNENNQSNG